MSLLQLILDNERRWVSMTAMFSNSSSALYPTSAEYPCSCCCSVLTRNTCEALGESHTHQWSNSFIKSHHVTLHPITNMPSPNQWPPIPYTRQLDGTRVWAEGASLCFTFPLRTSLSWDWWWAMSYSYDWMLLLQGYTVSMQRIEPIAYVISS